MTEIEDTYNPRSKDCGKTKHLLVFVLRYSSITGLITSLYFIPSHNSFLAEAKVLLLSLRRSRWPTAGDIESFVVGLCSGELWIGNPPQ